MLIGFDYETHLIGPQNLAPKPICLSAFLNNKPLAESVDELAIDPDTDMELATAADGDLPELVNELIGAALDGEILVGANVAFDLAVATRQHPELFAPVFQALSDGRISDVQVREKLLILASTGDLAYVTLPDGSAKKINGSHFSLAALAERHLGVTLEGKTKTNKQGQVVEGADAWRINYDVLEDLPLEDWPEEAVEYSLLDSVYPTLIWRLQEQQREELKQALGIDPLRTEAFRSLVKFCLYLMSMEGVRLDPEEHAKIVAELEEALKPENLNLLVQEGILRPGEPPRPHARGHRDHVEGCKRKGCDCPIRMTAAIPPSIDTAARNAYVEALKRDMPDKVTLRYTDKGNLQVDKEFMEDHYRLDPVIAQLRDRQAVQKLVTTDMPRMEWPKGSGQPASVLHASFDELKETGRTSSYASKLYPSWNCQNPHPRVRAAVVPREGYVLYSVDFGGMELGTLAQKCYSLFGHSVLRDVINKGWDAHAYLGAHLAYYLDDDFHESCNEECGAQPTGDQLYEAFKRCEGHEIEEVAKFYKHYRTFAKPTGLGYPGGLGPATFVEYAHATYRIEVDEQTAAELREVWHRTFPEMQLYLNWINDHCGDPINGGEFAYLTPLGMYRAGASYCAAANGAALQSPGAEGALLALCSVVESTYAAPASVLYPDEQGPRHRCLLFLHDELIGEAREDCAHEVAHEVARIMVESMSLVTPDVQPSAEPVLMRRWSKSAKPYFDQTGRLLPHPEDK